MNFHCIKIFCILVLCLFLSVQAFARVLPHGSVDDVKQTTCESAYLPCNDCPCDDGHGGRECDSSCSCCCESTFSLPVIITSVSFPAVIIHTVVEPRLFMHQVYFPIFVPPQNSSWS